MIFFKKAKKKTIDTEMEILRQQASKIVELRDTNCKLKQDLSDIQNNDKQVRKELYLAKAQTENYLQDVKNIYTDTMLKISDFNKKWQSIYVDFLESEQMRADYEIMTNSIELAKMELCDMVKISTVNLKTLPSETLDRIQSITEYVKECERLSETDEICKYSAD